MSMYSNYFKKSISKHVFSLNTVINRDIIGH
jgi:hypothetical protein